MPISFVQLLMVSLGTVRITMDGNGVKRVRRICAVWYVPRTAGLVRQQLVPVPLGAHDELQRARTHGEVAGWRAACSERSPVESCGSTGGARRKDVRLRRRTRTAPPPPRPPPSTRRHRWRRRRQLNTGRL